MRFVIELIKFTKKRNNQMSHLTKRPLCELVYVPCNAVPFLFSNVWGEGMTVAALVQASGLLQKYSEVKDLSVGIFARCVTWDTLVKPGDRVEIYRPLSLDPKEKRRNKAKSK